VSAEASGIQIEELSVMAKNMFEETTIMKSPNGSGGSILPKKKKSKKRSRDVIEESAVESSANDVKSETAVKRPKMVGIYVYFIAFHVK